MYANPTTSHETVQVSSLISNKKMKEYSIEIDATASRSLQSGSSKAYKVDDMWPETFLTRCGNGVKVDQFD